FELPLRRFRCHVCLNEIGHQCSQRRGVEHSTVSSDLRLPLRRCGIRRFQTDALLCLRVEGDDGLAVCSALDAGLVGVWFLRFVFSPGLGTRPEQSGDESRQQKRINGYQFHVRGYQLRTALGLGSARGPPTALQSGVRTRCYIFLIVSVVWRLASRRAAAKGTPAACAPLMLGVPLS